MRHVSFALVLTVLILSFGLSNAMDIWCDFSGAIWDDEGTPTINVNQPLDITILASNTDFDRSGWSTPFMFTGTGDVTTVTGQAFALDPTFLGFWTTMADSMKESWDGDLSVPDQFNFTGIEMFGTGFPADGVTYSCFTFTFTIPGDVTTAGTFCIEKGDFTNDTYDWLFDDPVPTFDKTCLPVAYMPNEKPAFDNCPTADISKQHHEQFFYDFNATDPEGDAPLTFSMVSGLGDIDPSTGIWTLSPACPDDIGSHTVQVGVEDPPHAGDPTICEFTITVLNTAPVIGGNCGDVITVGTNDTKTASFNATDDNTGDTQAWSITSVTPTPDQGALSYSIDATGLLSFTPNDNDDGKDFVFTVRVTDCDGDYDECDVTFTVVSEIGFGIKIQKHEGDGMGVLQGHVSYLEVTADWATLWMHGFDFLIGYDASVLTFTQANKGEFLIAEGWEYFTYRYDWNGNCGNACPSGLLRVVALGDQNDGPHHPGDYWEVDPGDQLFTMSFLISNDRTLECQYVPVYFYWMDCTDNSIAYTETFTDSLLDVKTAVSYAVYNYNGYDVDGARYNFYYKIGGIDDPESIGGIVPTAFPTIQGIVPDECLVGGGVDKPRPDPIITFFNGGFDIICADDIDARGDVNLNGIPNEIADVVVFTNYFIKGMAAFTIGDGEGQIAATEVNGDGIPLTVADLVYLIRIVIGDAQPIPKLAPNITANFVADGNVVSVGTELGAAYFVLAGDVSVSLADGAIGMEMLSGFDGVNTRVLVYSLEKGHTASGNILNTSGSVISAEAADYYGNAYKTAILPAEFGLKNYPNPFNPVTMVELSLPVASDWSVSIFNVAGQKVADFRGYSEAGVVTFEWEASDQASGIYFYKAEAGRFSATKKMVLLK